MARISAEGTKVCRTSQVRKSKVQISLLGRSFGKQRSQQLTPKCQRPRASKKRHSENHDWMNKKIFRWIEFRIRIYVPDTTIFSGHRSSNRRSTRHSRSLGGSRETEVHTFWTACYGTAPIFRCPVLSFFLVFERFCLTFQPSTFHWKCFFGLSSFLHFIFVFFAFFFFHISHRFHLQLDCRSRMLLAQSEETYDHQCEEILQFLDTYVVKIPLHHQRMYPFQHWKLLE